MVLVLLADDDSTQLTASADALLAAGHQVATAIDGQELMDELDWNCPDVLVCSNGLSGVDWQLIEQVRTDERFLELHIVLLGLKDDKDHRLLAFQSGVDDYLPKPFEPEELVWRLDRALGRNERAPKPPPASSRFDIHGRLENLSLAAVMRLLEAERKTGTLCVQSPSSQIAFSLQGGAVVSARLGDAQDSDLERCLSDARNWKVGGFWFAEQALEAEPQSRVNGGNSSSTRLCRRA